MIKVHTELSKCLVCIEHCAGGPGDGMSRIGKNSMLRGQVNWLGIPCVKTWEEFLIGLIGFSLGNNGVGAAS